MSRRRRKKSWISWVLILVLLIAVGVICWLVWEGYFKEKEVVVPEEEIKVDTIVVDNEGEKNETDEPAKKEEVVQYDGENPNNVEELTGAVTYAGVSGENLIIRVNIDQYLNNGECMLLLSVAGNTTYSNVAPIVGSVATATCEGFNVPMNLLESGHYDIFVEITAGSKRGTIKGEADV